MAHDVFISYSSRDKTIADGVCATLEGQGIRCWIAPRDVMPGMDYGAEIVKAIHNSQVMVMVFSSQANASNHIKREVERAVNQGLIIVPFRIENVAPSDSLEYFFGGVHWLDALSTPMEQHLQALADKVRLLLLQVRKGPIPRPDVGTKLRDEVAEVIDRVRKAPDNEPGARAKAAESASPQFFTSAPANEAPSAAAVARFCTRCGNPNTKQLKFCTQCGNALIMK